MNQLLFEPISFAGVELRNRIVYPPITTGFAEPDGTINDAMIKYYQERAEGGVGLIIVEPGVVHPQGKLSPLSAGAWEDRQISGLTRLVSAIKGAGAKAFLQLCHAGPKAHPRVNGTQPISASNLAFFFKFPPLRLSIAEIEAVVNDFVRAAERAKAAGFDGVEIHAAHFYLFSAFLSPHTNDRQDAYGGNVEGRSRIVVETIKAIKAKLGPDYPVTVRYHGFEDGEKGLQPEDAVAMGKIFERAGANALHISAYGVPVPELATIAAVPSSSIPAKEHAKAPFADYAALVKKAVNIPVIAVGKITEPELAEQSLAEGKFDLVAVGRSILVDPQWANKAADNKAPIRCIGCLDCINSLAKGPIVCRVNKRLK